MYISYKESNCEEKIRKNNNKKYIEETLKKEKKYFENMFKNIDNNIKLDEEQQKIILTDEDNLMVIAGAGSGKTTTITAKTNYLIEKQNIKDEEIMIISFTNKAVDELKQRINKDFKHNVKIMTFHKFGYEIIKKHTKTPPKINANSKIIIKEYLEKNITEPEEQQKFINIYEYYAKTSNPKLKINKKKLNEKQLQKKLKKIKTNNEKLYDKFIILCQNYIGLFKSKGYKYKDFERINSEAPIKKIFLEFLKKLYIYYEQRLEKNKEIDFDDIINNAIKIIKTTRQIKLNYKYIIIDEFQDISENRFELIKTIKEKINNKIMVVGDDWQCIYSFASSNINLFTQFKKNVKYCEIMKITNTYRNSQELIDIAGKFIQKNNKQISKNLKSNKRLNNPITIIKYKKNNQTKKICETLDYIIKKYGTNKNILILGRYTFDKNKIIDKKNIIEKNNTIKYKKYPETKIDFMTVHSAKGLGYDNIIIINANNDVFGFPSKVETEPILKDMIIQETNIEYAEERRLFYVALTRTKNEAIILTQKNKESIFIKELKKENNIKIKSCIK